MTYLSQYEIIQILDKIPLDAIEEYLKQRKEEINDFMEGW